MGKGVNRTNLLLQGPGGLHHVKHFVVRPEAIDRRSFVDVIAGQLLCRTVLQLFLAHAHIVVLRHGQRHRSARMTPDTVIVPETYGIHFRPDTIIEEIQRLLPSWDDQP